MDSMLLRIVWSLLCVLLFTNYGFANDGVRRPKRAMYGEETNEIKKLNFTFVDIISNVLITPSMNFTVFGEPDLVPSSYGGLALILEKHGQYIELPNNGLECLIDLSKCRNGFTLRADIKLLEQESKYKRHYLFSSGGDSPGTSGIAVFIDQDKFCCWARSFSEVWTDIKTVSFDLMQWHKYQISWNPRDGFYVYVDGVLFMTPSLHLNTGLQVGIHPPIVGSSFTTNITTFMEIKSLYTWTASRDILIEEGYIKEYTTPAPTTTTTSTTTTPAPTVPTTTHVKPKTSTITEGPEAPPEAIIDSKGYRHTWKLFDVR